MKSSTTNLKPALHTEAIMRVRMAIPNLQLGDARVQPENQCASSKVYIEQLLDLGFIYSHEIKIDNPIGKPEGAETSIFVYMNVDENIYALLTDLFHINPWVYFTNYYTQGQRIVTTSQPGALQLEPLQNNTDFDDLFIQNAGSSSLDSQWKRHRRLAATWLPNENSLLLQPDQHLSIERGFYLRYVKYLLKSNILRQSDTQTFRFTRSGARAFHAAISSKSARRPQPKVEEWIGNRGKLPVRSMLNNRTALVGLGLAASIAGAVALIPDHTTDRSKSDATSTTAAIAERADTTKNASPEAQQGNNPEALADATLADTTNKLAELAANASTAELTPKVNKPQSREETRSDEIDTVHLVAASTEDEMWRIAVENAEFYLMSNDGDPAPWIRTARKIAAGFRSDDGRLARTYFLAALLETDYRIAEQQYNRALSIQTKTLGYIIQRLHKRLRRWPGLRSATKTHWRRQ